VVVLSEKKGHTNSVRSLNTATTKTKLIDLVVSPCNTQHALTHTEIDLVVSPCNTQHALTHTESI